MSATTSASLRLPFNFRSGLSSHDCRGCLTRLTHLLHPPRLTAPFARHLFRLSCYPDQDHATPFGYRGPRYCRRYLCCQPLLTLANPRLFHLLFLCTLGEQLSTSMGAPRRAECAMDGLIIACVSFVSFPALHFCSLHLTPPQCSRLAVLERRSFVAHTNSISRDGSYYQEVPSS